MPIPIADLHCDLLYYLLKGANRTPYDRAARCSIPQLLEGNVAVQVLAIFAETIAQSAEIGWQQYLLFKNLPYQCKEVQIGSSPSTERPIQIIPAIENLSALCSEDDDLGLLFERLEKIHNGVGLPLYASLTWNTENRFGGGAETRIGLKEDGKIFLQYLHKKGIAIDLSHASDKLAFDILDYLKKNNLEVPVIASHSNSREIENKPRNLPDELISEIIRHKGLIGLNFYRPFLGGDSVHSICRHIEHIIGLGGENSLCLGADFFYGGDFEVLLAGSQDRMYYPELSTSASYPAFHNLVKAEVGGGIADKIGFQNVRTYLSGFSS